MLLLCSALLRDDVQDILAQGSTARDASGNAILADVGLWLRDEFKKYFKVRTHPMLHLGLVWHAAGNILGKLLISAREGFSHHLLRVALPVWCVDTPPPPSACRMQNEADVKYIDPSYIIRSIPTTSNDRIYCKVLGQGAVHGAFAGYTGFTVGLVNTHYVYLPIPTIIQAPRKVNPQGRRWNR